MARIDREVRWYAPPTMTSAGVLDRPTYTVRDAARWARTTPQTARRWVSGYAHHGDRWSPPITSQQGAEFLSFEDLVEVAVVASIRRERISMDRIRAAVEYAQGVLGVPRPLVSLRFRTDGRDLFTGDDAVRAGPTNLTRFGQIAMPHIEDVLRDVEYDADVAARWWPAGRESRILIDPRVNFGRPILAGLGIRTETIVDRWAGGDLIEDLVAEFGATSTVIQAALRFENRFDIVAA